MKIQSINILDFGQLTTDGEEKENSKNSPSGYFLRPEIIKFTGTTDKIKGIKGVKFGIQYFVKGFTDDRDDVTFLCKICHPTMTHPRTKEKIESVTERKTTYLNENNFDYFHFEFDWEIVTGRWTFEIIEGDRTLLTKEFQVI
jgi:hypothetical protein